LKAYINIYDEHGRSIGAIELEPRVVDELPEKGKRRGELVFNLSDLTLYFWDGSSWRAPGVAKLSALEIDVDKDWGGHVIKNLGAPADPNDSIRLADLVWDKIQNKPSTFPPEAHSHTRSEITDLFSSPFWDNIPDKPDKFPSAISKLEIDTTIKRYALSDDVYAEENTMVIKYDTTFTMAKKFTLPPDFPPNTTLRISFDLKAETEGTTVYGQIYRNGTAVGTLRSTTTTSFTTFTEDIGGWNPGDEIQLWVRTTDSSIGVWTNYFRILGTPSPFIKYSIQAEAIQ